MSRKKSHSSQLGHVDSSQKKKKKYARPEINLVWQKVQGNQIFI
jgi:hypothetical protein